MSMISKLFGDPNEKEIKKIQPLIDKINALEGDFEKLSDEKLKAKTQEFKRRLEKKEALDEILPEAFAVVREASKRTLGQRQYDVQLIGGIALHRGSIAEMRTGEGKTLTAVAPMYLNALEEKGAHLVTVNDYLAQRDTVWMGQVFHALGLSVACIQHEGGFRYDPEFKAEEQHDEERDETGSFRVDLDYLRPVSRREAYEADITYGTNNEFGFDYLRDNMVPSSEEMVQRELHYSIVDEVDSILIDEARTPLIISAPAEEAADLYYRFAELVPRLEENTDYNVDEKLRTAILTEDGISKMEQWLGVENLYVEGGMRVVNHLENALRAHALFQIDKDYVVKDGEVMIVDEFTGRLMVGRRYSEGLHQAIEAKEKVPIQRESVTMATITFQNYFRMYKKLAGMTGTAATEAEEFHKIYKLEVFTIPTNRPDQRKDLPDRVYKSELGKFKAVIREVKERNAKGQPILLGTASIEKNEILGELMRMEGIPHNLLNAKNHAREGEIVAQAGRSGAVTVATNMAGRGVDIVLGGNPPDPKEAEKVKALGGLFVLGTERHESRRIDNQLRGRAGRQGDPGETQFCVSMDDDLMRIFGSEKMKKRMDFLQVADDQPIENKILSRAIESAQRKVESHNFDIRKHLLEYDDVLNKHRSAVYGHRHDILNLSKEPTKKGERPLKAMVMEAVEHEIEQVVLFHTAHEEPSDWDLDEIEQTVYAILPRDMEVKKNMSNFIAKIEKENNIAAKRTVLIEGFMKLASEAYVKVEENVGDESMMAEIEKALLIRATDGLWVEHLEAITHLRKAIGLQGYGQRDPLVEYKREAYRLFHELLALIDKQIAHGIFRVQIARQAAERDLHSAGTKGALQFQGPAKTTQTPTGAHGKSTTSSSAPQQFKKVGRNEVCPCGSGKKYKKCHSA
ncbi:MAG: preprotein translocase subunit SecA [Patescibacteria group bacterium]